MIVLISVTAFGTTTVTISQNGENTTPKTEIATSDSKTDTGKYN